MTELSRWLLTVPAPDVAAFVAALAERATEDGLPVWRMTTGLSTMHPEIGVLRVFWTSQEGSTQRHGPRSVLSTPFFLESPMYTVLNDEEEVRRRLQGPDANLDYPICRDLATDGATDYVAWRLAQSDGTRNAITIATREPAGFDDLALARLRDALPALAARMEIFGARFATENLLGVYLGRSAARRVLAGEFVRGSGRPVRAAIWTCDLRGYTAFSDGRAPGEVTVALDAYFERVVGAIAAQGGEVLKFIGDAVLAIFPVDSEDVAGPCSRALVAARQAVTALDAWNAGRDAPLGVGVGLHLGEAFYGNVGGKDRLDFTVIGAAVNEACRLESLCKPLAAKILMTAAFRAHVDGGDLIDLGEHALRGVGSPTRVFGLREP
jgi:adenylate cyclase